METILLGVFLYRKITYVLLNYPTHILLQIFSRMWMNSRESFVQLFLNYLLLVRAEDFLVLFHVSWHFHPATV